MLKQNRQEMSDLYGNITLRLHRMAEPKDSVKIGPKEVKSVTDDRPTTEYDVVDAELEMLLPALQRTKVGRVVALVQSRRLAFVEYFPFQLHARWPDALQWFPLTANITVIPFKKGDLETRSLPFLRVNEVLKARNQARWARLQESRSCPGDFVHPDWEDGIRRFRKRLGQALLPPHAFVSVESVRPDGSRVRISRRTLGRHATRKAPRPSVFIAGPGEISTIAAETLASANLVLMNLQGLRGRRYLRTIQAVLAARPADSPTLLVASSPSELIKVGLCDPAEIGQFILIGSPSPLDVVDVITVARERLAADERFATALSDLSGQGASADRIVVLAQYAWWALRQSIHPDGGIRELQRFKHALNDLGKLDAITASLFTACLDLLHAAATDTGMRKERLRASVEAVLHTSTPGPILVLARTWKDAATLRAELARELGTTEESLETLDVWVDTIHSTNRRSVPGSAILVGYAGMVTIDAAVTSGTRSVRMVFDPVEARTAWYNAQTMADYMERTGLSDAAEPFRRLANGLSQHVMGFASTRELSIDLEFGQPGSDRTISVARPCPDEALIYLSDGSCLEVPLGARFEVLGRKGRGSRVIPVRDLEPGDEIVLLDDEARTLFSEKRVAALDSGPLLKQFQARSQWLAIVQAVAKTRGLSSAAIARKMEERGHPVTGNTVRSWLHESSENACVPMRVESFLALAEVLGLTFSEEMLRHFYHEIQIWRNAHRRAGREVAQAIRLAYTGRLGPVTLARIEREWGVSVRLLVAAARIGIVDEVVLPEEVNYAGSNPVENL